MKTRTAGTSTNPNQGRGPSLYSVETPSKDPLEGLSILGALEPGRSRARVGRRGLFALMTVLLLLPVTYLVATSSVLRQAIPMLAVVTQGFKAGSAKEPAPSAMPSTPVAAASPAVAEEASVATITTEPSAVTPALEEAVAGIHRETDPLQIQLPAVVAPVVEQAKAPEPAKPGVAAVVSAAPKQSLRRKETTDSAPVAAARTKRADARHPAVAQAHAPANVAKNGKNNDKDKDVDLIAALLTHISRPGSANKEATSKPSLALADSAGKRESRATNRDIVVHTAGESKASLITRCRSLGFLEGELCRIRICSGSWGTDPACSMDNAVRGD